jgi:hypothetical protein
MVDKKPGKRWTGARQEMDRSEVREGQLVDRSWLRG